jgi:D-alanyl-D-alanine carboxypeptidase/D-alanyl-D-alanine-endopeptidase (penicillin-binding protein 4)
MGIKQIAGDIVLDRSAFEVPDADPANFDGEPLRPYNAAPDALLINFKAVVMTFAPDRSGNTAQVQFDPPLAGVQMQASVPLGSGDCGDYRGALKADFSDAKHIRFGGSYAASCGEKVWPVAYADPRSYGVRAVHGMWLDMGGKLSGTVRYGTVPAALAAGKPALEATSAPLAEIIRDINKYSNNVMAQQVFLTLGRVVPPGALASNGDTATNESAGATALAAGVVPPLGAGSFTASRAVMQRWWKERINVEEVPVWDNGSGLSRQERISAQGLARLLQVAWRSPYMSELMSSLPITGVDGTLKRFKSKAVGSAHLKTGTLSNALARAGYVDGASGKRYVLVALINHANANTEAARAVMETLVDWAARDN